MLVKISRLPALLGILGFLVAIKGQAQTDTIPPEVRSHALSPFIKKDAANKTFTRISVYFTEPVDLDSVRNLAHYGLAGSTVVGARVAVSANVPDDPADPMGPFTTGATKVVLEVSPAPAAESPYTLSLHDIKDLAGNLLVAKTLTGTTPFYEVNLALSGKATQSSTAPDADGNAFGTPEWHGAGAPDLANDGDIDGFFANGSVTINQGPEDDGWWEVDLGAAQSIGRLQVWFRTLTADECQALFNACGVRNDDFRLIILDASRKEIFRRQYAGRPPGTVAYNLPPGVSGRYVRFEMQSPRTTSDGFFSLAEVAVIAPYENAAIQVTQSPAAVTLVENRTAKFGPVAATVTGAPTNRLQIQWQLEGVSVEGANANADTYTTPPVPLASSGSHYRALFLLPGVSQPTAAALLTVTADQEAPTLQNVVPSSAYIYVTVTFSERVRAATAESLANYQLDGGLQIVEITSVSATAVRLTTSPQTPGKSYTLTVNGVRDLAAGAGNLIAANTKKTFKAVQSDEDRFVTVGDPGNPADQDYGNGSGPQGSVAYLYQIGKYEVSNSEYAAFLNASAKSDVNNLWDSRMQITRDGSDGSYTYTVNAGYEKKALYYGTALDGMRYANWLHNGGTESSDTETGAYTFTGYNVFGPRNPKADFFLPNENEWYKAAYYDPTKESGGKYWLYPNRTSDPGLLNFQDPGPGNQFSLCFSVAGGLTLTDICNEDVFPLASSYYGTFNQAGGVCVWNEPTASSTRTRRSGGSFGNNASSIAASVRADNPIDAGGATINQGFRIGRAYRPRPEFVTVGNPGNAADQDYGNGSGPQGSVNYIYQIDKYEVNNSDYAIFLNAKAKSDPHALWDSRMQIARAGDDGKYTYTVNAGYEKKPLYYGSAVDGMRYANWLGNGAGDGDTETGSYTFTGNTTFGGRNAEARFVLPNENEWYKAAYYDPTKGGTGGYWLYPNRTSDPNVLNYQDPGPGTQFSLCFSATGGVTLTDVCNEDAFPLASSYYGTFNQAGSVWEWNEPLAGAARTRRSGGSFGNNAARIAASVRADNPVDGGGATINQGFRIGKVSPLARLTISIQGAFVKIAWTGPGILTAAPTVNGLYKDVDGVTGSPALVPVNLTQTRYFRLR